MAGSRVAGLVGAVLRCYPARWRRRHGEEAAELAMLLKRDGTPAISILGSYLFGAARERLTFRPSRRAGTVVGALLVAVASVGVSLGLVVASVPAKAASTGRPGSHSHCQIVQPPTVKKKIISTEKKYPQTQEGGAGHGQSC
jgi:hypothetical protein